MKISGITEVYKVILTGEIAGTTLAQQLPDIRCSLVYYTALPDNLGGVYLGGSSDVTIANDTTNTTTGIQVDAGTSTPWLPIDNINKLYIICDNESDGLTYIALRKS